MGFLSDAKAISDVQKIKRGGTARLSISLITNLIINLPDAKRNLLPEQFNYVYSFYKQLRKQKKKVAMNMDEYLKTAVDIIKEFDKMAPYEKYSGGNEIEFSILMQDIKKESAPISMNIHDELIYLVDSSGLVDNDYIDYLTKNIFQISHDSAKAFFGVLILYKIYGKNEALNKLDSLIKFWICSADTNNLFSLTSSVPFLCGTLFPNGVTSKEESSEISKKYSDMIAEKLFAKT